jgi:hypothetical protein
MGCAKHVGEAWDFCYDGGFSFLSKIPKSPSFTLLVFG